MLRHGMSTNSMGNIKYGRSMCFGMVDDLRLLCFPICSSELVRCGLSLYSTVPTFHERFPIISYCVMRASVGVRLIVNVSFRSEREKRVVVLKSSGDKAFV